MDNRAEVRDFLTTRRARITPEQAGLPSYGQRRVKGLRRSEVAALAGMSVEYYAKLERGWLAGASAGVLEAIARALQLDDAERAHLVSLAHEANGSNAILRPRDRPQQVPVRPSLQWSLDAITSPAVLFNNCTDMLAANHLGRSMYSEIFDDPTGRPNLARFTFLDSAAHRFFPDWAPMAEIVVAILRTSAGKDTQDKALCALVDELSTRSDDFTRRWESHNVRTHANGVKQFRHPVVGDLTLAWESLDLRAEPGLTMTIYTTEPGSASAQALDLLASWSLTRA